MMPGNIDFHCHLDLYPDHIAAFKTCEREKTNVLAVTTTPLAWQHNMELASGCACVRAALGLHPQVVLEREREIEQFSVIARSVKFIGEVGLDASPRFYRSIDAQRRVFERVLRVCAATGPKVLSIHAVRTASEVIRMLKEFLPLSAGLPILHWFSGTQSEALRALEIGCWFSINPAMGATASSLKVIDSIPIGRMLTESDGPFVKDHAGSALAPGDVQGAIELIARCKRLSASDVREQLMKNLIRVDEFVGYCGIYDG